MEISDRKKKILAAVIDEYITTAEPVGSKTIAQNSGLNLSSATIRNEMADLEAMGFLEQPHTSSGRVPSAQGYRLYVNQLMHQHKLTIEETQVINNSLNLKMKQLDHIISNVGQLTSRLTNYPAYALAAPTFLTIARFDLIFVDDNSFIIVVLLDNHSVKNKLIQLPFQIDPELLQKLSVMFNTSFTGLTEDNITTALIHSVERASGDCQGLVSIISSFAIEVLSDTSAGEAFVAGASHLLRQPEFRDPDKAHQLMSYLSDEEKLLNFSDIDDSQDIQVLIGPENLADELKDSSVIMASYNAGDNMRGLIGVVGPTRMDYSKVAAKLSYIANGLSRILGGDTLPGLDNPQNTGDDIDEQ
ncbi:MAG: heat-inducible transcriptional repressor HrcA [Oscillospiraceae bacterium]